MRKKNLLILGASGGVANAVLHYLAHHRNFFNKIILLDKRKKVLSNQYVDHKALDYIFMHKDLKFPKDEAYYQQILKKHRIDIVLDITDMDSLPVLESTDRAGISYINTALNDSKETVSNLVFQINEKKKQLKSAPHILCTGMNPGIVNMWVAYGIEKFGKPSEITHFEYDTSKVAKKWKSMMTWSINEFIEEAVKDVGGYMLGKDKVKPLFPNAIENRVYMKSILEPILKLEKYPHGFSVLHEENVSIAQKYDIPSRFIYAVNMKTMENLIKIYESKHKVGEDDLILGDNTNEVLEGSDSIGVILEYPEKRIYYFNTVPNIAVIGTNATYLQVAIGIFAALFSLLFDKLKKGTHFIEDLHNTHFKYYMFDNMRVQEFIFEKNKKGLRLENYNPEIRIKRNNRFEHIYI
jgi:homospermidine synthase